MSYPIKVILVGDDGMSEHISGKIDLEKIEEHHLLFRDGHLYRYDKAVSGGYRFIECRSPYSINEF